MSALVPAIIAVFGVLTVGILQALVNRQIHNERLRREAAIERRAAFTHFMSIVNEEPSVELDYRQAKEKWDVFQDLYDQALFASEAERRSANDANRLIDDRLRAAIKRRDDYAIRRGAAQMAALASVDTLDNPLVLIPTLLRSLNALDSSESARVQWDCMLIIHADGELNQKKRRKLLEQMTQKLQQRYSLDVSSATEQGSPQSPPGAGHQGTDNQSGSSYLRWGLDRPPPMSSIRSR